MAAGGILTARERRIRAPGRPPKNAKKGPPQRAAPVVWFVGIRLDQRPRAGSGQAPRYALRTWSSCSMSAALPDMTMVPVSMT